MAKTGEFLKAQLVKAGVDMTAENNKAFVESLDTMDAEIPDQIAGLVNSSLISIKEAKSNHPEIKNYYTAQVLDNLDREIDAQVTEYGLSDAEKDALKLEKNSYKKAVLLTKQVAALEKAKALADKPDQKKMNDQIVALNNEIASIKQARDTDKATYEGREKDFKKGYALDRMLSPYKTILDSLPGQTRTNTIRLALEESLGNNAAKFELDETGNIVLLTKEGNTFFDKSTNTPLNAKQFIERELATNKLLVNTSTSSTGGSEGSNGNNGQNNNGSQNNGQGGNNQNNNGNGRNNSGNNDAANNLLKELNEAAAKDYSAAPVM